MSSNQPTKPSMNNYLPQINKLLDDADAIVIGAGSGLSTAAGFTYSGPRFMKYFADFAKKYGIQDMYSGGFYPFPTPEEYWAWWSRVIWINRYQPAPKDTYHHLFQLVASRNYFVLTTNVDHQFQRAGFDKKRLFYTQGDYGLFQKAGITDQTFDNYQLIRQMVLAQGFQINPDQELIIPPSGVSMTVPKELVQEVQGYTRNLREDDQFVEDRGWHAAAERYQAFITQYRNTNIVYFELGVGMNTPGIIKYPFWQLTYANPQAHLITIDQQQPLVPEELHAQTIAIKADIDTVITTLLQLKKWNLPNSKGTNRNELIVIVGPFYLKCRINAARPD